MNNQVPGRRKFLSSIAGWIASFADEMRGIPQMELKNLNKVPDEIIREMIPVFVIDGTYKIEEEKLMKYDISSEEYSDFLIPTRHQMFIIRSFNGISTIADISTKYAEKYKLEKEDAFRKVRSLFIDLAGNKVCHPRDVHYQQDPLTNDFFV